MADLHTTDRLLVQIGSYNTNLQGGKGLPQDLVDWLSPTLQVSSFLSREPRAPDIFVVGFQELLPLHLGRMSPTTFFDALLTEAPYCPTKFLDFLSR
jgi:hypothetical protein